MRLLALILAFASFVLAGCSDGNTPPKPSSPPITVTTPATTTPSTAPGGDIAVYASAEAGSPESIAELKQIKQIGFNTVIAYGSMNGESLERIKYYLDTAEMMGINVTFSVKDIFGATDADEANKERHCRLFGQGSDCSTDTQVTSVIELLRHSAVKHIFIADEQPDEPAAQHSWLKQLEKRYRQLSKIKPVSVVLYWNQDQPQLYRDVKRFANELQIDFYPMPIDKSTCGGLETISDIGDTLWRRANKHGTFVVQAFGWDPTNHPEGKECGFTEKTPPPTTEQMVAMAKAAVVGHGNGGAMNLAFFALGEVNAASDDSLQAALAQIRSATWWQNRGK